MQIMESRNTYASWHLGEVVRIHKPEHEFLWTTILKRKNFEMNTDENGGQAKWGQGVKYDTNSITLIKSPCIPKRAESIDFQSTGRHTVERTSYFFNRFPVQRDTASITLIFRVPVNVYFILCQFSFESPCSSCLYSLFYCKFRFERSYDT